MHINAGFILVSPSNIPEFWIDRDVGSNDYRKAYECFLTEVVGVSDARKALTLYDLDHVYSYASAHRKKAVRYMLLLPVTPSVNRSWSSLEQARSGDLTGDKDMYRADYFTIAKIMGITAPSISKKSSRKDVEDFVDQLIANGCLAAVARDTELAALKILYNRVKDRAVAARKTAKSLPLPSRGGRDVRTGMLNSFFHRVLRQLPLGLAGRRTP